MGWLWVVLQAVFGDVLDFDAQPISSVCLFVSALDTKASNLSALSKKYRSDAKYLNTRSTYAKVAAVAVVFLTLIIYVRFWWLWCTPKQRLILEKLCLILLVFWHTTVPLSVFPVPTEGTKAHSIFTIQTCYKHSHKSGTSCLIVHLRGSCW